MYPFKSTLVACLSTLALLGSTASHADMLNLGATLSGAAEVPPNTSAGMGQLQAEFDKGTKTLRYTLRYSALSGPVKAAHFHGPAEAGKNAGVALGINNAGESPVQGSAVLTADQAADLLAGKWYVNVHTAANPGGELRGQVAPE
jgi:CHRD domain